MTAVRLQVANAALSDPEVVARIGASETLRTLGWKTISGITTMTVHTNGDVVADTTAAIRCAENAGFQVQRVYEDRVNVGEITRRLGAVSREAVRKWTAEATFPQARTALNNEGSRGAAMLWDWAEVVSWLQHNKSLAQDEDLPTEQHVAILNATLAGAHDYASDAWHHVFAPTAPQAHDAVKVYHSAMSASLTVKSATWASSQTSRRHTRTVVDVEYA